MAIKVKPSRRLRQLVAKFPTPRKAALEWGIEPLSLERFLERKGSFNINTAAQIVQRTGEKYEALFDHEE